MGKIKKAAKRINIKLRTQARGVKDVGGRHAFCFPGGLVKQSVRQERLERSSRLAFEFLRRASVNTHLSSVHATKNLQKMLAKVHFDFLLP
jgi:hypothetical protein